MLILYHSLTGNVRRFLAKTGLPHEPITRNETVDQPFLLVTNTIGFGDAPDRVKVFLRRNSRFLKAVAASGNRNWGTNFARAADVISAAYHVPILYKFELGGTTDDVIQFKERVKALAERSNEVEVSH
ncbi:class Ib ribonucleoside-diphosphate reductase assembly flavoprotein NrdI [Sporolactobacillus sp. THM7-4]|nr:class Ib ribonucleoside-diphosphate reductase assembly flavoprotein NrdI [Sporolactobacillus sp. THM7-4]